jgi:hypothetical protein
MDDSGSERTYRYVHMHVCSQFEDSVWCTDEDSISCFYRNRDLLLKTYDLHMT